MKVKVVIGRATLVLLLALAALAAAQEIDLVGGTLTGRPICELALDDITGMLGRPTRVRAAHPIAADILGPTVQYHHLGMYLQFRPGDPGEELLLSMVLYLSRVWDSDASEWYQVYSGTLSPNVNGNWRLDKTLADLDGFGVQESTPEDQRAAWEEAGILKPGEERAFDHIVRLTGANKETVSLMHEPMTRFMERATVACPGS